jgi:hypothetical protein
MNRYATPYNASMVETARWNMAVPNLSGAGAIKSTVNDMLKYMAANMGMVHTSLDGAIELTHKENSVTGMIQNWSIGLGWQIIDISGVKYITHGGATYGFNTSCYFDPIKKIGALVFTNSRGFTDTKDDVANFTLFNIISNEKEVSIDPAKLNDYVGTYHIIPSPKFGSDFYFIFKKEGNCLFADVSYNSTFEIFPESVDTFFWAYWDATATFLRDQNGKVYAFDYWLQGNTYRAIKIN